MRIVTLNIQYGMGRDGHIDLQRTAAAVEDADVIALQEVERYWTRSGNQDQVAELCHLLPRYHHVYGPAFDVDASYADAGGYPVHRRRQHGVLLLSLTPIPSTRFFPLPKYGTLTQHSLQLGLLEAVVSTPAGAIRVYNVKFSHLAPATRRPQITAALGIIARSPGEGGAWCGGHPDPDAGWLEGVEPPMPEPAVILGDMNFTPESAEYDLFVGPLSPHHGRLNHRRGFVDAWVAAGHDEHQGITCPPKPQAHGARPGRRLDYCFVSAAITHRVRGARIDEHTDASDHQPLWVELDMRDFEP